MEEQTPMGSKEEEEKGRERRESDPELHQYWLVYSRNKTLLMKLKIENSKSIILQRLFSS
jgi:hypothetical protein